MKRRRYHRRTNHLPAILGVAALLGALYVLHAAATGGGPWALPGAAAGQQDTYEALRDTWKARADTWKAQQAGAGADSPTGWRWTARDDDAHRILGAVSDRLERVRRLHARGERKPLGRVLADLEQDRLEWDRLVGR